MTSQALVLVLSASFFHATWNFLAKRSRNPVVFLWLSLVLGLLISVIPVGYRVVTHPFPPGAWFYALLTGALHAVYYTLLGLAYQRGGELSAVYPVARGTAPVLVSIGGVVFHHEWPSAVGLAGILLVTAGIFVIHVPQDSPAGLKAAVTSMRQGPIRLAFLTGVTISGYSLVDKTAMNMPGVDPWIYLYLICLICVLWQLPWMLARHRQGLSEVLREHPGSLLAVALMGPGTYGLILMALATESKVSYIVASRECSIVFAALLGTLVLKESKGRKRILGAAFIVAGVVLLALTK